MATFPALIVQGARQVGKSTFAGQLVEGLPATTVTLDDDDMRLAALADPRGFVGQRPDGTLVIDELQRAPELILAIKAEIDRDRRPGRFLLTGSSNLLALSKTPDSLAGRAVDLEFQGLSQGELEGTLDDLPARLRQGIDGARWQSGITRAGYAARITCGGYPEARDVTTRMTNVWFDGYVVRLLEKDLVDIESRIDSGRVASVLRLLAANQSGELVKARVARDAGISESSVTACRPLVDAVLDVDVEALDSELDEKGGVAAEGDRQRSWPCTEVGSVAGRATDRNTERRAGAGSRRICGERAAQTADLERGRV